MNITENAKTSNFRNRPVRIRLSVLNASKTEIRLLLGVAAPHIEEAAAIGLSRWLLLPCLGLTLMFGPVGWLLFMAMRFVRIAMGTPVAQAA